MTSIKNLQNGIDDSGLVVTMEIHPSFMNEVVWVGLGGTRKSMHMPHFSLSYPVLNIYSAWNPCRLLFRNLTPVRVLIPPAGI